MSSTTYSAELTPEPLLRGIVLLSGAGLALLGLVTALTLAAPPAVRVPVALGWLGCGVRELGFLAGAYRCCRRIRLAANGDAAIEIGEGRWQAATLCRGSVVLPRCAWLRVAPDGGRPFGELLRGNSRKNKDWRRLQVIWRHLGSAT